jgi:hypothetical protein
MSTFDPAQALRIDLARGQLSLAGSGGGSGNRLLVPLDSMIDLLSSADNDAITAFGAGIGTDMGRRVRDRLGSAVDQASVELFLEHLGGEIALAGLGSLSLERWGYALVLVLEGLKDAASLEILVAALLEAVIQRALSRDVTVVSLGRQADALKFAMLGRHAKDQVEQAMAAGKSLGDVLTQLHQSTQANATRGES